MGIIEIEKMEFWAYHGCFKEEQIVGNKFLVDLTIHTDCNKAAGSDELQDALDYQKAYNIVKEEISKNSKLLENICGRILDNLYSTFSNQIINVKVKVSKMNPPMGGQMERVSVTMER